MDEKNLSFEQFTKAIANLNLDNLSARPTAHTSAVVDFTNWDTVYRESQAAASE